MSDHRRKWQIFSRQWYFLDPPLCCGEYFWDGVCSITAPGLFAYVYVMLYLLLIVCHVLVYLKSVGRAWGGLVMIQLASRVDYPLIYGPRIRFDRAFVRCEYGFRVDDGLVDEEDAMVL